jgi:hypothetical protein
MAAISAARGGNADPPRSLDVVGCPNVPDASCHRSGCLCRIGHSKGGSVFATALSGRAVRSEKRLLSGRSGSGPPSHERLQMAQRTSVQQARARPQSCCSEQRGEGYTDHFRTFMGCRD